MSKNQGPQITVTLRKVSSGHRVGAFAADDLNLAYSLALIIIRSPEYSRCYAVATGWNGDTLFNVQPEHVYQAPAPYQAPTAVPQLPYYPPQQYPQQYPPQAYPQQPPPQHYQQPQYQQQPYQQPQYAPALPAYHQPQPLQSHNIQVRQIVDAEFEE